MSCSRLVQNGDRDERLADIVQQRRAGKTALIVLAHAEMLRERNGKAGDKETMPIAGGVMAADGRQPGTQRGVLDRLEDLVFRLDHIVEGQGNAGRKLLEYLHHHGVRGGNAGVQRLAAFGGVEAVLSGNAARIRCRIPRASNGRAMVSVAPSAQACIEP